MKKSLILFSLCMLIITSCGTKNNTPPRVSSVYDLEDILSTAQERILDSIIYEYQKKTNRQIMILTSHDIDVYENVTQYAVDYGHEQGKIEKGKNNGLVIFVSKNLSETSLGTGYGTDKSIGDDVCKQIIDSSMIPLFEDDKFYEGLRVALDETMKVWNGSPAKTDSL